MDHNEFLQLLDSYIDASLSPDEEQAFLAHAESCPSCMEELRAARALRDVLSGFDDDIVVPLQAEAAWKRAVRAEDKRKKSRKLYRAVYAVAAAVILVFGVGFMTARNPAAHVDSFPEAPLTSAAPIPLAAEDSAAEIEYASDFECAAPVENISFAAEAVASDGMKANSAPAVYAAERKYITDDVAAAAAEIESIASEYSASVTAEIDSASARLLVSVDPANAADFLAAISRIGKETVSVTGDLSTEPVLIAIVLTNN